MVRFLPLLVAALFFGPRDRAAFEAPDCPVTIDLPGEVETVADTLHLASGTAAELYEYSAELDSTSFLVQCGPNAGEGFGPALLDLVGHRAEEEYTEEGVTARATKADGYPAIQTVEVFDFLDPPFVEHRLVVLTDGYTYVLSTGPYTRQADLKRFFGSFRVRR
ncbi:MAG: hypothetical protein AAGI52_12405 [Bacteroidota bacterium]